MLDTNIIYEITQQFSNPDHIQSEFSEIMELISKHLRQKYVHKLEVAVQQHRDHCTSHPSKEIVLLQACKPFFGTDNIGIIDNIINMFHTFNTVNNIKSEYIAQSQQPTIDKQPILSINSGDTSIHEDGIYDIDDSCLTQSAIVNSSSIPNELNPIFIIIILFFILKH